MFKKMLSNLYEDDTKKTIEALHNRETIELLNCKGDLIKFKIVLEYFMKNSTLIRVIMKNGFYLQEHPLERYTLRYMESEKGQITEIIAAQFTLYLKHMDITKIHFVTDGGENSGCIKLEQRMYLGSGAWFPNIVELWFDIKPNEIY